MTGDNSVWRIGGASARGASHIRSGRPNQDALLWSPSDGAGHRIAAAVSDGHGAPAHFRSGEGAEIAVRCAVDILAWHFDEREQGEGEESLAGTIAAAWRRGVDAHLADHPFDPADPLLTGSRLFPYGATLLALAADEAAMLMLQIGDGDLLLGFADGRIESPLGADEGLTGEQTYSLCQEGAEARFRLASIWRSGGGAWPDFALLASDGVSKSFRDDGAFRAAAAQLRTLGARDWPAMLDALPEWLAAVSHNGSGDDATICIAMRGMMEPQMEESGR